MILGCVPTAPQSEVGANRYLKLAADGSELNDLDGPWACVFDRESQLTWEVKSPNENLQYVYNSFNMSDETSIKNGSCARDNLTQNWVEYDRCNVNDLVAHLNTIKLCGKSAWRVPTSIEMKQIMVKKPNPGERRFPPTFFPRVVYGPYWTSTHIDYGGDRQFLSLHSTSERELFVDAKRVAFVMLVTESH